LTTEWPPRDRSQRVPPQQDAILDNSLLPSAELSAGLDQKRYFFSPRFATTEAAARISLPAPLGSFDLR
jgi:hypothetical protein